MAERLSAEARKAALAGIAGLDGDARPRGDCADLCLQELQRGVRLHGARGAGGRKEDHHPEWRNVYKTVEVVLATHDAGGVTALDIELAKAMNGIARQLGVT